ncbi:SIR2 family protein [Bacillus cereus]|uniref:SIR2 family protein n=2 Tax=Bacillus cereus TaxID=1396 RepID=UPI001FFD0FF1|nr:SIR2 family protein [Bacillus cereus]UPJ18595.1 SIR2 family protein [Bacillus cereus]
MPQEIHIPNSITDAALNNRLVFFIGAGFSKDFDYPDWEGLVIKFLQKIILDDPSVEPFLNLLKSKKMEILDVLNYIKEEKVIISDIIKDEFKYDDTKASLLSKHKKLFEISQKVITTNYDKLLENAGGNSIELVVHTNTHMVAKLSTLDSFVYKIHGDHLDAGNCILLKEQYDSLYKIDNAALEQLKAIISNNVVLFIGFSMNDPYIANLCTYINKIYDGYNEKGFILTTNNEDFSEYNIKNINLKEHTNIPLFLDKLIAEIKKKKLPIPINKTPSLDTDTNVDVDEDELKLFILDFHKGKKASNSLDFNEHDIEEKFEKMVCSNSFRKELEEYSAFFPSIDEIMMTPDYLDFDNKSVIKSIVRTCYNKVHTRFDNGETIFEETVEKIFQEYRTEFELSKPKLQLYLKILVSWVIFGCDIFNEDKRKLRA